VTGAKRPAQSAGHCGRTANDPRMPGDARGTRIARYPANAVVVVSCRPSSPAFSSRSLDGGPVCGLGWAFRSSAPPGSCQPAPDEIRLSAGGRRARPSQAAPAGSSGKVLGRCQLTSPSQPRVHLPPIMGGRRYRAGRECLGVDELVGLEASKGLSCRSRKNIALSGTREKGSFR
jgi:hypothetical protein